METAAAATAFLKEAKVGPRADILYWHDPWGHGYHHLWQTTIEKSGRTMVAEADAHGSSIYM